MNKILERNKSHGGLIWESVIFVVSLLSKRESLNGIFNRLNNHKQNDYEKECRFYGQNY